MVRLSKNIWKNDKFKIILAIIVIIIIYVNLGSNPTYTCPDFNNLEMETNDLSVNYWIDYTKHAKAYPTSSSLQGWKFYGGKQFMGGVIFLCRNGNKAGENINNYYCGNYDPYYMQGTKTLIDASGSITGTIDASFIIEFDRNKKYLKTTCY